MRASDVRGVRERQVERFRRRLGAAAVAVAMIVGCGEEAEPEAAAPEPTAGGEGIQDVDDGMVTAGTLGTLPQFAIESTLQARQRKFLRCFTDAWGDNDLVGGEIRFVFRVQQDGSVRFVYPAESTVGDRETEQCLLSVAANARFPEPHGGEAEFTWSLAVDPMEDVRPPVAMEVDRVATVLSENGAAVLDECAPGGAATYRVTAYVSPGGEVLAAGVASRAEAEAIIGASPPPEVAEDALDCVAGQVTTWELPDPGSYTGKVSFELR